MSKRHNAKKRPDIALRLAQASAHPVGICVLVLLFFLTVCANYDFYDSKLKWIALGLMAFALVIGALRFSALRDRFTLPVCALVLYVLTDGVSTLYAAQIASGKLALYEFLSVLIPFCLVMILTALAPGEGHAPGRWMATVLSGFSAAASLVSIDLLSTHFLSEPVLAFLRLLYTDYRESAFPGVEAGVRMTSIFGNPNVFAGIAGLGVLLALGLASTEESRDRRKAYLVLLYINSLAFILVFSMGGTAMVVLAFLIYLILERRERRIGTLILMLETLALTMISAAIISMTSLGVWTGIQPIPLVCAALGAAALCLLDGSVGRMLADKLSGRAKLVSIVVVALVVVLAAYAAAAVNLTGPARLEAGESLRRAAYPAPGTYTLSVDADSALAVTIESQDQRETMVHTSTVLYFGEAQGASFTVPEDSLVVYFNFFAPDGAKLASAAYDGAESGSIPLGYRLLPGFMANRLQGLFANENAIQRLVFFEDGMKLFRRSPVFGVGLSGFENSFRSVQTFWYETQNVHNHYIEVMVDKGVVGLAVFLFLLLSSAAAVWFERRKKEDACPLVPALGAALVFMAGHAAVEVVFSTGQYLPMAFGVFALIGIGCGRAVPALSLTRLAKTALTALTAALVVVFGGLLGANLAAAGIAEKAVSFTELNAAIRLDPFEWTDHAIIYLSSAEQYPAEDDIRRQASAYAERMSKVSSAAVGLSVDGYYFSTGRLADAFDQLERDMRKFTSDSSVWQNALQLLAQYQQDTPEFREGAARVIRVLDDWNAASLAPIELSDAGIAFIDQYGTWEHIHAAGETQ